MQFMIAMNFSGLQNVWDLTPDTDLLKELPEEYTCKFDCKLSNSVGKLIWLCAYSFSLIGSLHSAAYLPG